MAATLRSQPPDHVAGAWRTRPRHRQHPGGEVQRKKFKINDVFPKIQVEVSPDRRKRCAHFFRGLDLLKRSGFDTAKYEICNRSLQVYALPSWRILGSADQNRWAWNMDVAREIGFDPTVGEEELE